jgi:hypothetical protein
MTHVFFQDVFLLLVVSPRPYAPFPLRPLPGREQGAGKSKTRGENQADPPTEKTAVTDPGLSPLGGKKKRKIEIVVFLFLGL